MSAGISATSTGVRHGPESRRERLCSLTPYATPGGAPRPPQTRDHRNPPYNGFGQRAKRTQGSAITWSVYDGDNLLLELDGSGNVLREYTM